MEGLLARVGLGHYVAKFAEEELTPELLATMSMDSLRTCLTSELALESGEADKLIAAVYDSAGGSKRKTPEASKHFSSAAQPPAEEIHIRTYNVDDEDAYEAHLQAHVIDARIHGPYGHLMPKPDSRVVPLNPEAEFDPLADPTPEEMGLSPGAPAAAPPSASAAEPTEHFARYVVAAAAVRVRAAPSLTADVLAMKTQGTMVDVDVELNGWVRECGEPYFGDQVGWLLVDGSSMNAGPLLKLVPPPVFKPFERREEAQSE